MAGASFWVEPSFAGSKRHDLDVKMNESPLGGRVMLESFLKPENGAGEEFIAYHIGRFWERYQDEKLVWDSVGVFLEMTEEEFKVRLEHGRKVIDAENKKDIDTTVYNDPKLRTTGKAVLLNQGVLNGILWGKCAFGAFVFDDKVFCNNTVTPPKDPSSGKFVLGNHQVKNPFTNKLNNLCTKHIYRMADAELTNSELNYENKVPRVEQANNLGTDFPVFYFEPSTDVKDPETGRLLMVHTSAALLRNKRTRPSIVQLETEIKKNAFGAYFCEADLVIGFITSQSVGSRATVVQYRILREHLTRYLPEDHETNLKKHICALSEAMQQKMKELNSQQVVEPQLLDVNFENGKFTIKLSEEEKNSNAYRRFEAAIKALKAVPQPSNSEVALIAASTAHTGAHTQEN